MLDPIAIHLGPLAICWYALCIVTGFDSCGLFDHERSA